MSATDKCEPRPGGPARDDPSGTAPGPGHRFRPEIQALRAAAVLAVVLYHLWPQWFPGGFIGVDVFFVVSGFLITGNMVREAERTGRLSLRAFWSNRVRRILPAGLLAIAVTALASIWLLPLSRLTQVTTHALASTFYVQNWVLAHESVDYLAQTNPETPFEHFWSLAVEEQFYIVWPLVVVLAIAVGNRARLRQRLLVAFGALVAGSFVWSVVAVGQQDASAYFATTTRLWELGAGALLALLPTEWRLADRTRISCAVGSLVVIALSVVLIQPSHPFPGLLALAPVAGAVLMIVAGPVPETGSGALGRVLGRRPVQWFGDTSYSLYLWHFPPIVMYVAVTHAMPGLLAGSGLAALSVGLACLSYYFVEQPTRRSAWLRTGRWRALGAGGLALALTAAVSCVPLIPVAVHQQRVAAAQTTPIPLERRGANAFDLNDLPAGGDPSFTDPRLPVLPDPVGELALPTMPGHAYYDCQASGSEASPACSFGDPAAAKQVAVVGDSNSAQYLPALLRIATDENWRVVLYTRSECPFSPDVKPTGAKNRPCPEANEQLLRQLVDQRPDIVFTSSSSAYSFAEDARAPGEPAGATGYAAYWNRLADAGIQVVVVRPIPRPVSDPVECVVAHLQDPIRCAEPRDENLRPAVTKLFDRAFALARRAREIDLSSQVCSATSCYQVLGNTLVFRDKAHFSVEFVETLTGTLRRSLR